MTSRRQGEWQLCQSEVKGLCFSLTLLLLMWHRTLRNTWAFISRHSALSHIVKNSKHCSKRPQVEISSVLQKKIKVVGFLSSPTKMKERSIVSSTIRDSLQKFITLHKARLVWGWCKMLVEIELLPRGWPHWVPSMPKNLKKVLISQIQLLHFWK